ncbi:hypothetical protein [Streptomyces sp. NPDC018972]|uniref:hypothetical protein n=1 Tax=Streptomyces sp. NPDC018972 TaxID=3365060 RepID=UPI0037B99C57
MSSIVKFFVASPPNAIDSLTNGPDPSFDLIEFGNFDAEEALLDWEAYLTGISFDELLDRGVPEVVAEDGEGSFVLLISEALSREFTRISDRKIEEMAKWWVDEKSKDGFLIDPSIAMKILRDLAQLVRQERSSEENIYCWMA